MSAKFDSMVGLYEGVTDVVDTFRSFFSALFALTVLAMILYPLVILVSASLRTEDAVVQDPLGLPTTLHFENFVQAWVEGGFQQYVMNSVFIVLITLVVLLIICSLAAYALVELDVPGGKLLAMSVIAGFMVPAQALFIPNFSIMNQIGLLDTPWSLILAYVGFSIPFTFFLIYQSFSSLPKGYADAARVEGVSELTIFTRIYVPLTLPSMMAVVVVQFVWLWNEFLYALTFITTDAKRTVPAGLMQFSTFLTVEWDIYSAGIIIAVAPAIVIFYLFQNYFIEGFTRGRL
jgi:raffinose/stachyose/melibiose transport system permease protein